MNSNQLKRLSAWHILVEQHLLQGETEDVAALSLIHHGYKLVEVLAKKLGVALNPLPANSPLLNGSLATFQPLNSRKQVGILSFNAELDQADQTFAVAHELAHLVLHKGQAVACRHADLQETTAEQSPLSGQVEVYNPKNAREREANLFALELLMPSGELRRLYQQFWQAGEVRSDQLPILERLTAHFGVKRSRLLLQLIQTFLTTPLPVSSTSIEAVDSETISTPLNQPASLDEDQQAAVVAATPTLVLAGPGSGKTTTLVERVRYLVQTKRVEPAHILVLTFSNRAAGELRERLTRAGLPAHALLISTFHAYGLDFLRRYAEICQLPADFRLLDRAHEYMLLEDLLAEWPAGHYLPETNPTQYFKVLLEDFSRAKDYLNTPQSYQAAVDEMRRLSEEAAPRYTPQQVERAQERTTIFALYEWHKASRGVVDFSDLVLRPVLALRQNPTLLQAERDRYHEILVDEYQDINFASGELLRLLASPAGLGRGNIWAVGDIHQSIYRFRGAYPAQAGKTQFERDYGSPHKGTNVQELRFNYRSLEPIVALASHLRQTMPEGATKPMIASRAADTLEESVLHFSEFENTGQETAAIIASIQSHRAAGGRYADHAILCQRHTQADKLAQALIEAGIRVSRVGQFFTLEAIQLCQSAVAALTNQARPAYLRLGQGRLPMLKLFGLAAQHGVADRLVFSNPVMLAELTPAERRVADELDQMLESLGGLRNIWRLLTEYVFGWSGLIPRLTQAAEGNPSARQSLHAIGQFIQLAYLFDQEEEAWLVEQARQKAPGHTLTLEQELAIRRKLNRISHRHKFTRYVKALHNSNARLEPKLEAENDQPEADAVHIMTAHASKGLEFERVYLPGLRTRKNGLAPDTAPPGLYGGQSTSQDGDTPCLFYVSATRAKTKLFLSWAALDYDPEEGARKTPQRHSRHAVLEPVVEFMELEPLRWHSLDLPPPSASVSEEDATAASGLSVGNAPPPSGDLPTYNFWELQTYSKCPARYCYQHLQKCGGRTADSRTFFYNGVSAVHTELKRTLTATGELPDSASLLATYDAAWPSIQHGLATKVTRPAPTEEVEPTTTRPPDFYYQNGLKLIEQLLDQYRQPNQSQAIPTQVLFNQSSSVTLSNCVVNFQIDRIEGLPDGTRRLIRSKTGSLPASEDKLDDDLYRLLTLYSLAGRPTDQVVLEAVGSHGVGQVIATKAAKKAADYRAKKAGQIRQTSLLEKLEEYAAGIQSGQFRPNRGRECQNCPFYMLLCPTRLE